jgi:cytochrome P450
VSVTQASTVPSHVPPDAVFNFDIYADARVTEDVQGSYAAVLEQAPDIFFTPANGGHWVIRRLADIAEVLADPEHFSAREATIPRVPSPPVLIPFNLDPPEHFPYRQALMPWFSASAVERLEPRIRHWAKLLIARVQDVGECDFIAQISAQFPVSVFMEFMGMPPDRLPEFRQLVDDYFKCVSGEDYVRVTTRIRDLMGELIDIRQREPREDLLSALSRMQVEGRPLTRDEMLSICHVLFLGGMDTVTNVLGFSFRHLAADPALQARLRSELGLIPRFVDEAVRCFGTANSVRIVRRDCERFGVQFREGDMILSALPVAGRDDRVHVEPDRFDIDRPHQGRSHLTFSGGVHLCLGHILARAELRIFAEEWLRAVPEFGLQAGASTGFRMGLVHAIETLPLVWEPSTAVDQAGAE